MASVEMRTHKYIDNLSTSACAINCETGFEYRFVVSHLDFGLG